MNQFESQAEFAKFSQKRREAMHDALRNFTPLNRRGIRSGIARRLRRLADRLESLSAIPAVRRLADE